MLLPAAILEELLREAEGNLIEWSKEHTDGDLGELRSWNQCSG